MQTPSWLIKLHLHAAARAAKIGIAGSQAAHGVYIAGAHRAGRAQRTATYGSIQAATTRVQAVHERVRAALPLHSALGSIPHRAVE